MNESADALKDKKFGVTPRPGATGRVGSRALLTAECFCLSARERSLGKYWKVQFLYASG